MLVLLFSLVGVSCDGIGTCVGAHEEFGKEMGSHTCCEGLVPISREDGIWKGTEPYPGTDYPEGCGPTGDGPDAVVCLPCGDGTCGDEENYCNCPEDCAAPEK
jgi:hypothetical protein